jgi:hypothetical protein
VSDTKTLRLKKRRALPIYVNVAKNIRIFAS